MCIYRPHSDSTGNFSRVLAGILCSDKLRNNGCIVLGDLKVNILDSFSEVHSLLNLLQFRFFVSVIYKPSSFPTNENIIPILLDKVWTNQQSVLDSGIHEIDFSEHCPVYCRIPTIATYCHSECVRCEINFRDTTESNMHVFKTKLSSLDCSSVRNESVDLYIHRFRILPPQLNYHENCQLYMECFITRLSELLVWMFPVKV